MGVVNFCHEGKKKDEWRRVCIVCCVLCVVCVVLRTRNQQNEIQRNKVSILNSSSSSAGTTNKIKRTVHLKNQQNEFHFFFACSTKSKSFHCFAIDVMIRYA